MNRNITSPGEHPVETATTRLDNVTSEIRAAVAESGRPEDAVRLVAVGKRHPAEKIRELADLGHRDFGENYLQEAADKIDSLAGTTDDSDPLIWHFIGHIQSRKCREIAQRFDWVHTVDSLKVARRLNQGRSEVEGASPLNVLIQVNIDDEDSKSGVAPEDVHALASEIAALPFLALRGLMIIPRAETDFQRQRGVCQRLRNELDTLRDQLPDAPLDHLSMGMSGDLRAAILEGATMVRVGTALFGQRPTT